MHEHAQKEAELFVNSIRDDLFQRAEDLSEKYVYSVLGLNQDQHPEETKKQYIDLFISLVKNEI